MQFHLAAYLAVCCCQFNWTPCHLLLVNWLWLLSSNQQTNLCPKQQRNGQQRLQDIEHQHIRICDAGKADAGGCNSKRRVPESLYWMLRGYSHRVLAAFRRSSDYVVYGLVKLSQRLILKAGLLMLSARCIMRKSQLQDSKQYMKTTFKW